VKGSVGRFLFGVAVMVVAIFMAATSALWVSLAFVPYEVVFVVLLSIGIVEFFFGALFLFLSGVSVRVAVVYFLFSAGIGMWIVLSTVATESLSEKQGAVVVVLSYSVPFSFVLLLGNVIWSKCLRHL